MSGPRRVEVMILGDSRGAQRAFRDLTSGARAGETQLDRTARRMQDAGRTINRAVTRWVVPAATATVWAFGQHDQALTRSTAIMADVDDAMRNRMAATSREVAADLNISASDAADAYFFLASAGLSAAQSVEALPQVARFAKAGMFDLARATDLSTDAQSALGLAADDARQNLTNLSRVTDVLVKANTLANASVEEFSTALTNRAGAALRAVNKDVEEGVAVLAAFADQGTKGQRAGEALNIILRDLQTAALNNADAFRSAGVQVFDVDGNMRNLADIIGDVEQHLDGLSDAQTRAALTTLGFQDRSVANLITLLGTSDAIRTYEEQLRQAAGTTEQVADRQMEAFNEQLGQVRQRLTNAAIEMGETFAPAVLTGAQALASLVEAFTSLPGPVQATILGLTGIVAASGPVLAVGGRLLATYSQVGQRLASLAATAPSTAQGFAAIGASAQVGGRGLTVAARGAQAFGRGITAVTGMINPWTLAIAGATTLLIRHARAKAESRARIEELTDSLDEHTGAITDNTRALVINQLQEEGALRAASELGIATNTLVEAALGNAAAQDRVAAATGRARDEANRAIGASSQFEEELEAVRFAATLVDRALGNTSEELTEATRRSRDAAEAAADLDGRFVDLQHALDSGLDPAMARAAIAHQETSDAAADLKSQLDDGTISLDEARERADELGISLDDLTDSQRDTEEAVEDTTHALRRQADELRAQTDPTFGLIRALEEVEEAHRAHTQAVRDHGEDSREAEKAALDLANAAIGLRGAVGDAADTFTGRLDPAMRDTLEAAGLTEDQISQIEQAFRDAHAAGQAYEDEYNARVRAEGLDHVLAGIRALRDETGRIGGTNIRVTGGDDAQVFHDGGIIGPGAGPRLSGWPTHDRMIRAKVGEEVLTEDDPRHVRNLPRHHTGGIVGRPGGRTTAGVGNRDLLRAFERLEDRLLQLLAEPRQLNITAPSSDPVDIADETMWALRTGTAGAA